MHAQFAHQSRRIFISMVFKVTILENIGQQVLILLTKPRMGKPEVEIVGSSKAERLAHSDRACYDAFATEFSGECSWVIF